MDVNGSALEADAGEHMSEMKANYYLNGDLYFTAEFPYEYTIRKAPLVAKVLNAQREYGDENPIFGVNYSGFLNNDSEQQILTMPTITTSATATSPVGVYPISIYGGEFKNYELSYEDGVLTVTKSRLSAKVKDMTKTYGEPNPSFALEYYGLKNGETAPDWEKSPVYSTDATITSNVGNYSVSVTEGILKNYELGNITEGVLCVTPAALTIRANNAARTYYSENPSFSYSCSGFVNRDDETVLSSSPSITTTATLKSGVGTYEIRVSGATSTNYSISFVNGTLTITPRTLMASVGNYERAYKEENPDFVILYDGFMGDDDEKTLNAKPMVRTTATKTSDVGVYTISLSGGSFENYSFTYTSGILTINKAE